MNANDVLGLRGKVVLITGGGGGFGRQCGLEFAKHGAKVVVAELSQDRAADAVADIEHAGGSAVAAIANVAREADVKAAVDTAVSAFGTLDILVNNAGISLSPDISLDDTTEADWDRVLNVNLKGAFFGCKHAAAVMRTRGGGSIVNISSGASLVAYPGVPVYSASKGGLNAMTRALALDLGRYNIRVNAVCPSGGMSANMLLAPDAPLVDEATQFPDWDPSTFYAPLWRPTPPRMIDHARVVVFVASPAAGYLTGLNLPSDGGMSMKGAVDVGKLRANWAATTTGEAV